MLTPLLTPSPVPLLLLQGLTAWQFPTLPSAAPARTDLELRFLLGEPFELPAEFEGRQHGVLAGDGEVGPAGDAFVGVDAGERELEQIKLPAVRALQAGAGDLVRPRNGVALLHQHFHNLVEVLLASQGERGHPGGKAGVVDGVIEEGHGEGLDVHFHTLLLVKPIQELLDHAGLVGVHGHQQCLVDLPEVKLHEAQQGLGDLGPAGADGQVEGLAPGPILRLIQLPQDPVTDVQHLLDLRQLAIVNGSQEAFGKLQLLVDYFLPVGGLMGQG